MSAITVFRHGHIILLHEVGGGRLTAAQAEDLARDLLAAARDARVVQASVDVGEAKLREQKTPHVTARPDDT